MVVNMYRGINDEKTQGNCAKSNPSIHTSGTLASLPSLIMKDPIASAHRVKFEKKKRKQRDQTPVRAMYTKNVKGKWNSK